MTVSMIGQTLLHYQILEELGRGGMGVVYKARDTKLNRTVALKFLPRDAARAESEDVRLLHEARTASAINHPNVCTVYSVESSEQGIFISMEYVDGESISMMIRNKSLDPRNLVSYAAQIAEALREAHRTGVVHRDVKSENILVNSRNQIKVMDFGLAHFSDGALLTRTSMAGSLAYMSPEQVTGAELDSRTDLWSFGVVLYEMAGGRLPFQAEHDAALMYMITNVDPPIPHPGVHSVPGGMWDLIARLLQKDRGNRPSSMEEVLDHLKGLDRPGEHVRRKESDSRRSIAVLPLANLSPDPENEFFSDGMTDEISSSLSRLKQLRVCSRSMAMQYKGKVIDPRRVGTDLSVDVILEGSVRRIGNRVRLNVELTDAKTGFQVWAQSFDRQIEDVFAVQDEVARTIVDSLELQLTGDEQVILRQKYQANAQAYDEYLRGRHLWGKRHQKGVHRAIEHFRKAIAIDESYTLAHAGLAICYSVLSNYTWMDSKEAHRLGQEALRKAVKLEPELDEVLVAVAEYMFTNCDLEGAGAHYQRAIQANPSNAEAHHWFAYVHLCKGDFDNALRENTEALRLEPLYPIISAYRGFILFCMGNLQEAYDAISRSVEIDELFSPGYNLSAWVLAWMGRFDEALESVSLAEKSWGESNQLLSIKAVISARRGDSEGGRAILARLEDRAHEGLPVHPFEFALINAAVGDTGKMFEALAQACRVRFYWWFVTLKVHPVFEPYRGDPRFRSILSELGLE